MKALDPGNSRRLLKGAVLGILMAMVAIWVFPRLPVNRASGQGAKPPVAPPPTGKEIVELAPYMGELQRLTHKLSLAVRHGNYPLASFYLYESLESLEDIKTDVPEYRGLPIALMIDQLSTPHYGKLKEALKEDEAAGKPQQSPAALRAVVNSCNQCHAATKHAFIKITDRGDFNPFNQDFKP